MVVATVVVSAAYGSGFFGGAEPLLVVVVELAPLAPAPLVPAPLAPASQWIPLAILNVAVVVVEPLVVIRQRETLVVVAESVVETVCRYAASALCLCIATNCIRRRRQRMSIWLAVSGHCIVA